MWEEEKKRKGRTERLFSNGVIILVFLILTAQAVFFTRHLIINSRRRDSFHPGQAAFIRHCRHRPLSVC